MRKQAAPSGRDIAITAGSGALSGLAGYAMARLLGAGNKKALGIGAGAGVAGAGLGYAGSAYGARMLLRRTPCIRSAMQDPPTAPR